MNNFNAASYASELLGDDFDSARSSHPRVPVSTSDTLTELVDRLTANFRTEILSLSTKIEGVATQVNSKVQHLEKTIMGATTFANNVFDTSVGEDDHSSPISDPPRGRSDDIRSLTTTLANVLGSQRNPAFKPQPYDGKDSWPDYRRQFDVIAARSGWSEEEKSDALAAQLRGEALSVLGSFRPDSKIAFGLLCQALDQRFGIDPATCLNNFRHRTQKPKETIQEYALSLQSMASYAFLDCPAQVGEKLIVSQFIDGLRDTQVQMMVQLGSPPSMREAIRMAVDIDARVNQQRRRTVFFSSEEPPRRRRNSRYRRNGRNSPGPSQSRSDSISEVQENIQSSVSRSNH